MEQIVRAHMPGLVARVVVNVGDRVQKGQEVAVINCMKTELSVQSEYDGVVKEILVKEWDEMEVGSPMVVLDVEKLCKFSNCIINYSNSMGP
ncbi:acetyl-CoA carboxylase biotin carboxyl carrier protein subunit [Desulfofundulus thermocisternus]|jgi:biotin carboxyl carrier protein|nr:acetyl-CoA carboxylase biotin carboxyl carrier protein subunit [Desulfofundulus thermocisternus]